MTGPADYPRDLVGYGRNPPHPHWPGGRDIAVQFVLNYEEGGENSVLHGDPASETFLSEIVGATAFPEPPHEDGVALRIRLSCRACGACCASSAARAAADHLRRGHGARAESAGARGVRTARRRDRLPRLALDQLPTRRARGRARAHRRGRAADDRVDRRGAAGLVHRPRLAAHPAPRRRTRRLPVRRRLLRRRPAVLDARSTAPDHLVVPYTLDTNDMRFASPGGFGSGDEFFAHLRDAFDVLYAEGVAGSPKMLSIGLHCRLVGRPARIAALERFLDHVQATTRCGSPVASTSRGTGLRTFHPVRRISLASWLIRWTTRSEKISGRPPRHRRSPRRRVPWHIAMPIHRHSHRRVPQRGADRHQSLDCWHSHRPFPGRHAGRSPGPAGHARAIGAAQRPIGALRQSDACDDTIVMSS